MSKVATTSTIILGPFFFIYSLLMKFDFIYFLDSMEAIFDYVQVCVFSLLGYNLQFPSHSHGSVLVTGASSSIGGHLAVNLADRGYIVFAGVNQLTDAHKLKSHISLNNQKNLIPVLLNVTNYDQIQKALQTITHHFLSLSDSERHLIGIVNCVGTPCIGPLEAIGAQDWLHIMNANVVGPFQVISVFLPLLRQSVGRVINLSSANSMTASPNNGVYSASKSALESATDTLRNEVFRFGISVSLIIPGSVDTSSHYQRSVHSDALRVQLTPIQKNLYEPLVKGSEVIEKETSKHKSGTNLTTRAFFHALFSETPKSRYMVGLDSKLTRGIRWVFSDRLLDWGYQLLMYQFEKHD